MSLKKLLLPPIQYNMRCNFNMGSALPYVALFAYLSAIDGCQIFGKIQGNFPISPKIGGRREESNYGVIKLHHTPNVGKTRAVHLLVLRSRAKNNEISNRGKT